ncbi:MAG TPA: GxxExxY protein [Verrucomicrobiae bacterium]|jgi:GxxExxY protein|nr:GxxExxY protein [Verrucomicrobiae bacterium]
MKPNEITAQIVDAAYRIHTQLGPGLLETVYEVTLAFELQRRGLRVRRQIPMPVEYEGSSTACLKTQQQLRKKCSRRVPPSAQRLGSGDFIV